ncbi:hypothetical protein [Corynebacterium mendelii]
MTSHPSCCFWMAAASCVALPSTALFIAGPSSFIPVVDTREGAEPVLEGR